MPVNSPPGRWIISNNKIIPIGPVRDVSTTKMVFSGDGHLLASSDVAGTVAISAGGSAVVQNYATAYAVAPYVSLTPTTDLGNLLIGSDFWVNSKTGSFVAFISPVGGAVTFNYLVIGSIQ